MWLFIRNSNIAYLKFFNASFYVCSFQMVTISLPGVPARFANCCKPLSELKVALWWCGPEDFYLNDIEKKASRYWVQIVASLSDWQTCCIPSMTSTKPKNLVQSTKLICLVIFSVLLGAFLVILRCFSNCTGYSASCRLRVIHGLESMWRDNSLFSALISVKLERSLCFMPWYY